MTQLIDLGKLRFHFAGDWNSSTTYESNDIVKYGGNVYVYTHALKTAGNTPTDNAYWALMVEGFKFSGVFDTETAYRVGDGVAHGGKIYVCILDCTNQTPPNNLYWSQFVDGIQYEGAYSGTRPYQKNDVVTFGGCVYIAKVDTTNHLPTDATYWDRFVDGVSAQSVYNGSVGYVVGDLVAYGSNIYRCIQNSLNNLPTNTTYWTPFMYGFANKGVWNSGAAYKIHEYVTYGGSMYQALMDNTGFNPSTETAKWSKVTYGFRTLGDWTTATSYITDDVVNYGGNTYIALTPHASTVFATDLAANKWHKFNSGIRFRGQWNVGTTYLEDDVVTSGSSTYICIASTTVGGVDPFMGDNNNYALLAAGAENFIARTGDQMEGPLLVRDTPSLYDEVINKGYIDDFVEGPYELHKDIWANITSAVRLFGGIIQNNGDGTVRVGSGGGLWKKEASSVDGVPSGECEPMQLNTAQGGMVFFDTWNAVANLELTNNAYNYIFVVWDHTIDNGDGTFGNTKVISSTNFYLQDWQNDPAYDAFRAAHPELTLPENRGAMLHAFTVGRVYKMDNEITIRVCGTNGWNFNKRLQLFGEEFFPVIRARGLDIQPIAGTLQFNVTEGVMWAEMVNRFTVQAFRMDHGDTFTAWYQHTAENFVGDLAAIQAAYPTGIPNRPYDILRASVSGKYYRYANGSWGEVLDYIQSKVSNVESYANLAALQAAHPTGYINDASVHDYVILQLQATDAFYKFDGTRAVGDRWVIFNGTISNYVTVHFIGNVAGMNATYPNGYNGKANLIIHTDDDKYYEYSGVEGSAGWKQVQGYVERNGWLRFYKQNAVDPNRYNDAQNDRLLDIPAGRYGVAWIYMVHDNSCHVVYGQGSYTAEEAKQAALPTPLPGLLSAYSTLVGKMTFAHGATAFENSESPFLAKFISSGVSLHNDLAGLDGGSSQQAKYYHLDEATYNAVQGIGSKLNAILGPTAILKDTATNLNVAYRANLASGSGDIQWGIANAPAGVTLTGSGLTATLASSSTLSAQTANFTISVTSGSTTITLPVTMTVATDVPYFNGVVPYVVKEASSVSLTFAQASAASGTITHTLTNGSLPTWATLNSNGTITGTTPALNATPATYTFTVTATNGTRSVSKTFVWSHIYYTIQGQALFGTNIGTGTFTWIAPSYVNKVSVVAVGGGGNGPKSYNSSASGGCGGGLGWKNNIPVVPGQSYTVVVGGPGSGYSWGSSNLVGGDSYFISRTTVAGYGGGHRSYGGSGGPNANGYGGGYYGDGGGAGGNTSSSYMGGSGAGGYTGNGGNQSANGAGGGGGAGGNYSSTYGYSSGGGVGLLGAGTSGVTGLSPWQTSGGSYGAGGAGSQFGPNDLTANYWYTSGDPSIGQGAHGQYGENPWSGSGQGGNSGLYGGAYGGGGGGQGDGWPSNGGPGGQGGVRIIWGEGRSFPNTLTNNVTPQTL